MIKNLIFIFSLCVFSHLAALPSFDTEMRGGVVGSADWELAIRPAPSPALPVSTGQLTWASGTAVKWSMTYTAATGQLVWLYNIGNSNSSISATLANTALDGLKLWVSNSTSNPSNSISVTSINLSTGGNNFTAPNMTANSNSTVNYVFSVPVNSDFVLTGSTTLNWGGSLPSRSALQFHVTATALPTPEPSTLYTLIAMVGAGLFLGLRKELFDLA